jgi:hypothetical protein
MKKSSILAAKIAGAGALALLLATSAFADNRPQDGTRRDGDHRDRSGERVQRDRGDRSAEHADRGNRSGETRSAETYRGEREQRPAQSYRGEQRVDGNNGYRGERRDPNAYRGDHRDANAYRGDHRNDGYRGGSYRGERHAPMSYREFHDNGRVYYSGRISRYVHDRGGYRVWVDNGPYWFWVPEARWRPSWRIGFNIYLGGIFRSGVVYTDVYDDPYYDGGGYYDDGYRDGYRTEYVSGYVDRIDYRIGSVWIRDDRDGRIVTVDTRALDRYSRLDDRDLRPGDRVTFTGTWLRGGLFSADRIDTINTRPY